MISTLIRLAGLWPTFSQSVGASRAPFHRLALCGLAAIALFASPARATEHSRSAATKAQAAWPATLDRVVPSVVSIRIRTVRAFDTERASYALATGFVVDAERGILLTNRHVVGPGPTVAEAVFSDHEEVELTALYRDPIHDFGLYHFDPKEIHYQPVQALPLMPTHATVGREIRVVGNDAGEKLSILAGTIARVDRAAPRYGRGGFNDFNTFYIQAASSTSGGSSGSPVVDVHGHVVALNAGGQMLAASSYYLPLNRVVRALDRVRAGKAVPRGTLQTTLVYEPFDELRRLGLGKGSESAARAAAPHGTGLLVVRRVSPKGPADKALKVGDILISMGGKLALDFLTVDEQLDAAVNRTLPLVIERDGKRIPLKLKVGDLHAITPSRFLEVGGSVLNPLSYQLARQFDLPVEGVYLAKPGYLFSSGKLPPSLILKFGETQINTLQDLQRAVQALPSGARVPVRYATLDDPNREQVAVVSVDRRFFPVRLCHRVESGPQIGHWPCQSFPQAPPAQPPTPQRAKLLPAPSPALKGLAASIVEIDFRIPYRVDGVAGDTFLGTGIVLDAKRGLVVTDRDTVPVALGDAEMIVGGSVRVPIEVIYIHPLHNFTLLHYDPRLLKGTPLKSAPLRAAPPKVGESLWLMGLTPKGTLVARRSEVTKMDELGLGRLGPPRFREQDIQLATLGDSLPTIGGLLADRRGKLAAFWFSFQTQRSSQMAGMPTAYVQEALEAVRRGGLRADHPVHTLGAEMSFIPLHEAREQGLPAAWAARFEAAGARSLPAISRIAAGVPAAAFLKEGDLILRAAGKLATELRVVERAARGPSLRLSLLREGKAIELKVPTLALSTQGTDRVLLWAGLLLQTPHWPLAADWGQPLDGVYISWIWNGSPASRYGLRPTRRIVAVDGAPVTTLDSFIALVKDKPERGTLRIETRNLRGRDEIFTLLLDLENWPTQQLRHTPKGWVRSTLSSAASAASAHKATSAAPTKKAGSASTP